MNIQDEIKLSEQLITEARKIDSQIGYFIKINEKPISGDFTVELTNGIVKISFLVLLEYNRSRKRTPHEFIEQIAWSFEPKVASVNPNLS